MSQHPSDPSRPYARRPEAPLPSDDEPETVAPGLPPVPAPRPSSRSRTPLETVLLASTAALLAAVAWPIAFGGATEVPAPTSASLQPTTPTTLASTVSAPTPELVDGPAAISGPSIQIALLLDTSSSMSGLIDQSRSQLWSMVNALDSATLHGERPTLEIALYEYGNSELHLDDGFIRQVSPFTTELDRVAEKLFELETMGGSEHAGQAIGRSIDELEWHGEGLKVVYIAGNESFDQGPVPWPAAIERARSRGIVVNTVNCNQGAPDEGWRQAASLAGGRFLQIDHNAVAEHIVAPQDEPLARLGLALNETYVGYGQDGAWGMRNQIAQDSNSRSYGSGSVVQRAVTKSSANYVNPSWDLLDALETGTTTIDKLDRGSLPANLREMSNEDLDGWVDENRETRARIKKEMAQLARERSEFVSAQQTELDSGPERLDTAIVRSIVEHARDAGFTIEPTP